ncbi:MAG: hypothetical protein ACKO4U_22255, partial [Caldilinea sp.]
PLRQARTLQVADVAVREDTLLRCLVACLVALGGVPWAVTIDTSCWGGASTTTWSRTRGHTT